MWLFWDMLLAGTLAVCLATAAGFLGRSWWIFDLASHFRAQYFVLLGVSAIVFLLERRYAPGILAATFSLVNLGFLLPFYRKRTANSRQGKVYRVLLANVLRINQSYDLLRQLVRSSNPDLIALVEISQEWMQALAPIRADYPYEKCVVRSDDYGLALLSRIPFKDAEIHYFGGAERPSVVACMELDGRQLTVVTTHPPPPKSRAEAQARNLQFAEIAEYAAGYDSNLMLMGDFNVTPWSPHFRDLLRDGKFNDSRVGFGLQPSWPTGIPFLRIPIDHILVSGRFDVHERKLGPKIGSDHFPVILDFALTD
ncbi:MAG: endonuclease/exonuclease/phosphatase family protein [Anaerolineales bacterium]|jgi:endonuclease/exonuclease/phosphatase (EEP) superfamily protein YafD